MQPPEQHYDTKPAPELFDFAAFKAELLSDPSLLATESDDDPQLFFRVMSIPCAAMPVGLDPTTGRCKVIIIRAFCPTEGTPRAVSNLVVHVFNNGAKSARAHALSDVIILDFPLCGNDTPAATMSSWFPVWRRLCADLFCLWQIRQYLLDSVTTATA